VPGAGWLTLPLLLLPPLWVVGGGGLIRRHSLVVG